MGQTDHNNLSVKRATKNDPQVSVAYFEEDKMVQTVEVYELTHKGYKIDHLCLDNPVVNHWGAMNNPWPLK